MHFDAFQVITPSQPFYHSAQRNPFTRSEMGILVIHSGHLHPEGPNKCRGSLRYSSSNPGNAIKSPGLCLRYVGQDFRYSCLASVRRLPLALPCVYYAADHAGNDLESERRTEIHMISSTLSRLYRYYYFQTNQTIPLQIITIVTRVLLKLDSCIH